MNYILKWKLFVFYILLLTLWFHFQQFGQQRKREIRLMKNREAARECRLTSFFYLGLTNFNKCMWIVDGSSCSFFRNKKKEYIKCLENRVAVLENQNKVVKRFQYCTSFASTMTICNTSPFSGPYRGVKKSKRTVHRAEELTLNHFDL